MTARRSPGPAPIAFLLLASLLAVGPLASGAPASAATAFCNAYTDPFSVTSTYWGTPGSPQSVYPGDQDVPLTVVLLFAGPCDSPSNTFQLLLSSAGGPSAAFTGQDGNTQPSLVSVNVYPNTLVTETFYLNVSPNAPTSASGFTYSVPMDVQFESNDASSPITQQVTVHIALYGEVKIAVSAGTSQLLAGAANNLTLSVTNSGAAASGPVSLSVTAPAGVTLLGQPAATAALSPNASASERLELFLPSSLSGTALELTVTATYFDAYSNEQSTTQTIGFLAVRAPEPVITYSAIGGALVPGRIDTVDVTVSNEGSGAASSVATAVTAPAGFSVTSQFPTIGDLPAGGSANATLTVFVPASSANTAATFVLAATYTDAYGDTQSTTVTMGISIGPAPSPSLDYTVPTTPLVPGIVNVVPVNVSNTGTGSANQLRTQVTGSSQSSVLDQLPLVKTLAPGASASSSIEVYVPKGMAGSSFTLSVTSSFVDANNASSTFSQALGLYVGSNSTSLGGFSLSVTPVLDSVTTGTDSGVSFEVKNIGNSTVYTPTFSISVPAPLVVAGNSTFTALGLAIPPGGSQVFESELTASPSASAGIYQATVHVTFEDRFGNSQTTSFFVPVNLSGAVLLVVQDESFSQNATALTVTGNVLNEGYSPAYYSAVVGSINGSGASKPDYVGEVDVNTPVPFSVTIPYTAQGKSASADVVLSVQYKNSLGQAANSSSSSTTHLLPVSDIPSSLPSSQAPASGGPSLFEVAILGTAVLVTAGVAGVGTMRRRRRRRLPTRSSVA